MIIVYKQIAHSREVLPVGYVPVMVESAFVDTYNGDNSWQRALSNNVQDSLSSWVRERVAASNVIIACRGKSGYRKSYAMARLAENVMDEADVCKNLGFGWDEIENITRRMDFRLRLHQLIFKDDNPSEEVGIGSRAIKDRMGKLIGLIRKAKVSVITLGNEFYTSLYHVGFEPVAMSDSLKRTLLLVYQQHGGMNMAYGYIETGMPSPKFVRAYEPLKDVFIERQATMLGPNRYETFKEIGRKMMIDREFSPKFGKTDMTDFVLEKNPARAISEAKWIAGWMLRQARLERERKKGKK